MEMSWELIDPGTNKKQCLKNPFVQLCFILYNVIDGVSGVENAGDLALS